MKYNAGKIILISAICLAILTITTAFLIHKKNKSINNILIIGDSQSAIKTDDGKSITITYPNILKKNLSNKGVNIDVLASIGKTTEWMKNKLTNRLKEKKYDLVLIYGGGNDVVSSNISVEETINNIQEMVNVSKKNGADVIVNLGYKVEGNFANHKIMPITRYMPSKDSWIPKIEKKKELQRKIPLLVKDAIFVPAYDLKSNTEDGIHPNATGHKIVAEKIYEFLLKVYFK